jgi:acyl-CoA synthetase (NDP forming)
VFATAKGAIAADVRIVVDYAQPEPRHRPSEPDIVRSMNRIMKPKTLAVIGASAEDGKIGNSVMKNLINGGYKGQIYPIHPKAEEILGYKAYKSVKDVEGDIDVAVFAIPAKFVAQALTECGEKQIAGAVLIPSGFAETGNHEGQKEIQKIGRKYNIRLMGPEHLRLLLYAREPLRDLLHRLRRQGLGRPVVTVRRHRHGDHRLLALGQDGRLGDRRLGNKSDIDEDDLLAFFEQDDNTKVIAQHCEDLKDGRAFAEAAKRVSKKKPVIVLKAGRTSAGAKAAASHTGALAGNDKIYEDVLKQSGVVRARSLRQLSNSPAACRSCRRPRARTSSSSRAPADQACSCRLGRR